MSALDTVLVHPPAVAGEPAGATSTPIYQTATFALDDGPGAEWDYSRTDNPTRRALEQQLARLDGAPRSLAYSSGMAAVGAALGLVAAGGRIVAGDDLYGGTVRLLTLLERRTGVDVRRVDCRRPEAVEEALEGSDGAMVFVETPSNPRLRSTDVAALARVTTRRSALLAVDNSLLSPLLLRPLEEGADLAVQSATKLLGGHGDLTAGVVSARDEALAAELAFRRNAEGTALAPFPSWLLSRGLATLAVRLERQLANTRVVVDLLRSHQAVQRLYYPTEGPGGTVVSFETGSEAVSRRLLTETQLFRTTVSFGSVSSSISRPWEMSHAAIPEGERRAAGLAADLVRLSVGIEDAADLVTDLERALTVAITGPREVAW